MSGRFGPGVLPTPKKHWGESLADALGQGIQSYEHFTGRREAAEEQERQRAREADQDAMAGIFDASEYEGADGSGDALSGVVQPPQAERPPVEQPPIGSELAGVIDPQAAQTPPEPKSTSGVPGGFDGRAGRFERRRLKPVRLPSGRMYDPNVVADRQYGEQLAEAMARREAEAAFPEAEKPEWDIREGAGGFYRVDAATGRVEPLQGIRPKPPAERQGPTGTWSTQTLADGSMVQIHSLTGQVRPISMNGKPVVGKTATGATSGGTEGEKKNAGFLLRAQDASPTIDNLGAAVSRYGMIDQGRLNRSPSRFQTRDMQLFKQASRQFATAILRKDSGATITDSEEALMNSTYIPQPGDDPDTVARKSQARRVALKELELAGGRANAPTNAPSADVSAIMQRYGLEP